jgi:glycine/D-amino acid oxidase-like deaminating enzyme
MPGKSVDVVVVGAGVVGAACAYALVDAGLTVAVLDRAEPAGGTTSAGEGNVLVSDKAPGAELTLAQRSRTLWQRLADRLGPTASFEWETKGGLVVATDDRQLTGLAAFADAQRAAGVRADPLDRGQALAREPLLRPDLAGAMWYPEDAQVQPTQATVAMLAAVRTAGGVVQAGVVATGVRIGNGRVDGVKTSAGEYRCAHVVNACGPWAGAFAARTGVALPVQPRRGVVLVTAPLPAGTVRHKVYAADYVDAVASDESQLMTSTVVEATAAGTVLIGSSRQRVGFDDSLQVRVIRQLAREAGALLPALADVPIMRVYGGFRPYLPDHMPVIGPDPRLPGLWHATGHEGAGVCLAPATGELLADKLTGRPGRLDPAPFQVSRFLDASGRAS